MKGNEEKVFDSKKINKFIQKTAEETAKGIVEQLRNKNMIKPEMSYYKRVEILLYNYENLKDAVKQKDEDIKDLELNGLPQKSGSVVIYSTSGGGIASEERYMQLREKYILEKKETERDLRRIDKALNRVKKDKYYKIIELKYLKRKTGDENVTDDYLAELLSKDRTTIIRNRKRLINTLVTVLFPESIKEII